MKELNKIGFSITTTFADYNFVQLKFTSWLKKNRLMVCAVYPYSPNLNSQTKLESQEPHSLSL